MPPQLELEPREELRTVAVFSELSRDQLVELAVTSVQRRVQAGANLVEQGSVASHLEVLVRGAVKIVRGTRHSLGESSVVLEVARAPAILCGASLFDGLPEPATVVALRASHVISVDRRTVLRMVAQHPAFSRAVFTHLSQSVRRQVRRIDEVASGPVDERVKHLLEGLAHDHGTPFGQGRFIAIPLRRRDIACMVNATTETVSRVLARFEREGLTRSTRDGIWLRVTAPAQATASRSAPPPPMASDDSATELPISTLRAR
jgi:CRP-like cAMP-binding protein